MPAARSVHARRRAAAAQPLLLFAAFITLAACIGMASLPAPSAADQVQSAVVSANIAAATTLDTTDCATGISARTALGTVIPGSDAIGTLGCTLLVGSSNASSRLRMYQADGLGAAMFSYGSGELDPAFGTGGEYVSAAPGADEYRHVERLSDGSFIVAGLVQNANLDIFVEHRSATWALDSAFAGGTGRIVWNAQATDAIDALRVDSSGRIYVMTVVGTTGLIRRYQANGTPDASFGSASVASLGEANWMRNMTVLRDGRIAWSTSRDGSGGAHEQLYGLLTENGQLDTSFGGGAGVVSLDLVPGALRHETGAAIVQLRDGTLLGVANMPDAGGDPMAVKLNLDGSLDTSFQGVGYTGALAAGSGRADVCCAHVPGYVTELPDGRILIGGTVNSGANNDAPWLVRLNADGSWDTTLAGDGVWDSADVADLQGPAQVSVVPLSAGDGMFVSAPGWQAGANMIALRLTDTGDALTSFSTGGRLNYQPTGAAGSPAAQTYAMVEAADGKVLMLGRARIGGVYHASAIMLAAYPIAQYDAGGGAKFGSTTSAAFGACLVSAGAATATAPWYAQGASGCDAAQPSNWLPIARGPAAATYEIASTTSQIETTVDLRFGLHTIHYTRPGTYIAPIVFEVLAPS